MPAARYAIMTRPEQSNPRAPVPPHTYGLPDCATAKAIAVTTVGGVLAGRGSSGKAGAAAGSGGTPAVVYRAVGGLAGAMCRRVSASGCRLAYADG